MQMGMAKIYSIYVSLLLLAAITGYNGKRNEGEGAHVIDIRNLRMHLPFPCLRNVM